MLWWLVAWAGFLEGGKDVAKKQEGTLLVLGKICLCFLVVRE
jgi:hypothetical protein